MHSGDQQVRTLTVRERAVGGDGDVGRGEADGAATFEAVDDGPGELVVSAKEAGNALHIALAERFADGGGTIALVVVHKWLYLEDFEAQFGPEGAHAFDRVLRRAAPERCIGAEHHEAHAEEIVEGCREVFGWDFGDFGGESEGDDPFGAGGVHEFDAIFERSEVAWADFGPEDGDGVWVQGDNAGGEVTLPGFVAKAAEQRLVAEMDAIEHANREGGDGRRNAVAGAPGGELRGGERWYGHRYPRLPARCGSRISVGLALPAQAPMWKSGGQRWREEQRATYGGQSWTNRGQSRSG
jgi:hypothetical protein